ncbi:hypothetical protein C8R44DRAFT_752545 [Mycena epipterygia]|nr:hypothetical protein C8R44DRAFT_752545 [Mycena epipterygia]
MASGGDNAFFVSIMAHTDRHLRELKKIVTVGSNIQFQSDMVRFDYPNESRDYKLKTWQCILLDVQDLPLQSSDYRCDRSIWGSFMSLVVEDPNSRESLYAWADLVLYCALPIIRQPNADVSTRAGFNIYLTMHIIGEIVSFDHEPGGGATIMKLQLPKFSALIGGHFCREIHELKLMVWLNDNYTCSLQAITEFQANVDIDSIEVVFDEQSMGDMDDMDDADLGDCIVFLASVRSFGVDTRVGVELPRMQNNLACAGQSIKGQLIEYVDGNATASMLWVINSYGEHHIVYDNRSGVTVILAQHPVGMRKAALWRVKAAPMIMVIPTPKSESTSIEVLVCLPEICGIDRRVRVVKCATICWSLSVQPGWGYNERDIRSEHNQNFQSFFPHVSRSYDVEKWNEQIIGQRIISRERATQFIRSTCVDLYLSLTSDKVLLVQLMEPAKHMPQTHLKPRSTTANGSLLPHSSVAALLDFHVLSAHLQSHLRFMLSVWCCILVTSKWVLNVLTVPSVSRAATTAFVAPVARKLQEPASDYAPFLSAASFSMGPLNFHSLRNTGSISAESQCNLIPVQAATPRSLMRVFVLLPRKQRSSKCYAVSSQAIRGLALFASVVKVRFGSGSGTFSANAEPELPFGSGNPPNLEPEPEVQVRGVWFSVRGRSNPEPNLH